MRLKKYIYDFIRYSFFFCLIYGINGMRTGEANVNIRITSDRFVQIRDTFSLNNLTDSLRVFSGDSIPSNAVDTAKEQVKFSDIITYKAQDSIRLSMRDKKMFLYKNTELKYIQTELKADYTELNMEDNTVYSSGLKDTADKWTGKPVFKDGNQEFTSEDMKYNFKTGKGYVKNIVTQEGEGYVQGALTKRISDKEYFLQKGLYTTCDQHECPHFYIRMSKAKMIRNKKVFFGFSHLVIEEVPLPLFLPFGFFPMTKKYSSGFIMPSYGEEQMRGFNLRNGGYYWAINDYIDLTLTGDIYTNGSWSTNLYSNYTKKYKYRGSFNFTLSRSHIGDRGAPDYSESSDWSIRWQHSQDSKANPYRTFSASVDMSSSTNNYYNADNINDIANKRKSSSITWSKRWPDSPFSLNASFQHNQNSRDSTVSITLPSLSLNMTQIYPFRRKEPAGQLKWYENIGFTYSASMKNEVNNLKEDRLFKSESLKEWKNGFQHNAGISTSINLIKNLSFSPSFRYEGAASINKIKKHWETDTALPMGGRIAIDTVRGLFYAHNYSASFSMSYTPTLYGMFMFKPDRRIHAVRHVIRPSVSASYTPKLGVNNNKEVTAMFTGQEPRKEEYNPFQNSVFRAPSGLTRESASLSFSLDNNLEMKVRNDKDTSGNEEFKKIKLIESFRMSTGYNPFAEKFRWSNIQMAARTRIFKDKMNLNLSAAFDPYALDENGNRINTFHGGIGRLTHVNGSTGIQFSADQGKNKEEKNEKVGGYYDRYMDFDVPWSISIDYNFNYSKYQFKGKINQSLRISGDISLTPKWKLGYNTGYDFDTHQLSATNFNISRDLHCWEMTFSCIPFGKHQSYNFQINVRSSLLKDLKLIKRDSWYDRGF